MTRPSRRDTVMRVCAPLSASRLIEAARRRAQLDDFGQTAIEEALAQFLDACEREADLSVFGRLSTRWDCGRLLTNLLILRERERVDPTILSKPIRRPIFIMGLPRSGTTFLHSILAEDADNRAPRCWQTIYPVPDHPAHGRRSGPEQVERQFSVFRWLAPEIRRLHPFDAHSPQECTEITAHSFRSLRFDTTYDIPSYRRWLQQEGHEAAYHFHRRFLQHLQVGPGRRWVLKSPDHVFALDALQKVYPDARIVFVHRDPLEVLPSVAKLTEVLRRPFSRRIDRLSIGRQVAADWTAGAARIVSAAFDGALRPERVHHVRYPDLVADPMGVVRSIYAKFDLHLDEAAQRSMADYVQARPDGGYGRNAYRFEDFGLDPVELRRCFEPYVSAFDVDGEGRRLAA